MLRARRPPQLPGGLTQLVNADNLLPPCNAAVVTTTSIVLVTAPDTKGSKAGKTTIYTPLRPRVTNSCNRKAPEPEDDGNHQRNSVARIATEHFQSFSAYWFCASRSGSFQGVLKGLLAN